MDQTDRLRLSFASICDGYSVGSVFSEPAYVKHLGYREHVNLETKQAEFRKLAKDLKLKTNDEKLLELKKRNLWGDKEDQDIEIKKNTIERFVDGKKKATLPSMVKQYDSEISKQQRALNDLLAKKYGLIGLTVETHAEKLINDYYILKNIFRDKDLNEPFFQEEEFDNLDDNDISDIVTEYNKTIDSCSDQNIKRLSIQDFYQEYFYLCGDDLSSFFGRPIVDFTYYQIRLGNYSKYFKSIFENNDMSNLPKEKRTDPSAIEDFISTSKNARTMLDKQGGAAVGLVGATKEDLKSLGLGNSMGKMPDKEMNKDEFFNFLGGR